MMVENTIGLRLKIQKTKNNIFITLINLEGKLLLSRSLKPIMTDSIKAALTHGFLDFVNAIQKASTPLVYFFCY